MTVAMGTEEAGRLSGGASGAGSGSNVHLFLADGGQQQVPLILPRELLPGSE